MVHVRLGVAYLWLGAYSKAEEHLQKALDTDDGLDFVERQKVKEDLASVQRARATLATKDKADKAVRHAHAADGDSSTAKENVALEKALNLYGEALEADADVAVVYANRCFANMRAGELQRCLDDADAALTCLNNGQQLTKRQKNQLDQLGWIPLICTIQHSSIQTRPSKAKLIGL
jgi:tetratricopeptide (TPR) repeat protein